MSMSSIPLMTNGQLAWQLSATPQYEEIVSIADWLYGWHGYTWAPFSFSSIR